MPPATPPVLVLQRKIFRGISLAYVPWGPELPQTSAEEQFASLAACARAIKPRLPRDTAFIRFDPLCEAAESGERAAPPYPLIKSPADIQPPDTVIVDLTPDEDQILARMKNKTRYNVRLGTKNVKITRPDAAGLDIFYALFRQTCARDGIALHSLDYYAKLFELSARRPNSQSQEPIPHLYLAACDDEHLAAIITLFYGETATYLYGASANHKRNLMAPYALQWQAMRDAKAAGCAEYDLFGIPPNDNPAHPMHGLWRFKTGFGGRIVHRIGSWDYPLKPLTYKLFRAAEAARKLWRDRKKH